MSFIGVFRPKRFGQLFLSDAMNVSRDPTLMFATVLAILPAIAFHFGADAMDRAAFAAFGIEALSRYVAAIALCLPAFIIGWVTGFLFLEDRDDGPLLAVDVTPTGKSGFMAYRIAVTVVLAIAITLVDVAIMLPGAGLVEYMMLPAFVAMQAVAAALILPALARNKVEGLALTKLTNLMSLAPLLAILPSPVRYFGGVIPSFWVGEMLRLSSHAYLSMGAIIGIGIVVHLAAIVGFYRLATRQSG